VSEHGVPARLFGSAVCPQVVDKSYPQPNPQAGDNFCQA